MSTPASYTGTAKTLHWLAGALIACGFSVGLYMVDLPFSPSRLSIYSYHKWIGVSAFVLVVLRLAWRLGHVPPPYPAAMPRWQLAAAGAVHLLLYMLMLAIPVTGWLYSSAAGVPTVPFGVAALQLPDLVAKNKELADTLRFVHRSLNYSLAGLVALHVAAAIGHRLVNDHAILARMLPGVKQ
jgi:cytochrome b561